MEVFPGRPSENTAKIVSHIKDARTDGVKLVIFPEMAVPGYLIGDEWEHEAFLRECEDCGREICAASKDLIVIFGNVGLDWHKRNEDGRVRKYNALFVAEDGRCDGPINGPYNFVIKTLHPNYREFDDSRHFFDLRKLALEQRRPLEDLVSPVKTSAGLLACAVCEDAWDADYSFSPFDTLSKHDARMFINISSSPFTMNKNHKRNRLFSAHAARLRRPLVFANNVGIQNNGKTVFTFDGSSCIYDCHGNQASCGGAFEETYATFDIPLADAARFGEPIDLTEDATTKLYDAIVYGTRKFMAQCGVKRVTVGVSGGIDSAVVASIYRQILEPENLLLVNMPSKFNSSSTRHLAAELASNLGAFYAEIPIQKSVDLTRRQIDQLVVKASGSGFEQKLELSSFMMENVQARDRSARVLASISAAFGGVFTCNANKSEATVGYSTLYGDLAGYFANIADVWKTEIYELARHINENVCNRQVIPQGSMDIVPSAELSETQNVDEGNGDPLVYPYHDCLFKSWVEWWDRATPEEILGWHAEGKLETKLGYKARIRDIFKDDSAFIADLERWWGQYQGMGLAKRIQSPPVLAVKRRAFGFDHRESQMGVRYTRKYNELRNRLLDKHC
jgi:NAD+ synthase (glutamine-hydrolysing)